MRLIVGACAAAAMQLALADPPSAAAPSTSATQPAQATTATPAAPAAQPSSSVTITAEQAAMEKHFVAEGYKVEMRHGQKYYCRREETLGTRLGGQKFCSTEDQLKATEAQARDLVGTSQRQQTTGPSGR